VNARIASSISAIGTLEGHAFVDLNPSIAQSLLFRKSVKKFCGEG
jgi:hypothetical protein